MTEMETTGLLLKLADMGITGLFISYEGGGDSGAIEQITYITDPSINSIDDLEEIYDNGIDDRNNLDNLDTSLYSLIENFAYATLLDDIEDWYNNEGGFGYVLLHVKTGEYRIHNSVRYYETNEYTHSGSLIEKTAE